MPAPRLFLLRLAGGLLHPANVAGQTAPPRQVIINRGRVPDATLARLEAGSTTRIPDGRYWYDRVSGAWVLEGGHTRGFTTAGLELGGRLPADISGGGTGVFINGREIHPLDLAALPGSPGVLHGSFSYVLQDEDGQTSDVHSVSAGLDYPGVGPEHSYWKDAGRVRYTYGEDAEALTAFDSMARSEGILPALESSHAIAKRMDEARKRSKDEIVVVCLSGGGDKDGFEVARRKGMSLE